MGLQNTEEPMPDDLDIWKELPAVHYDDNERFGTVAEMIAEIKRLRKNTAELTTLCCDTNRSFLDAMRKVNDLEYVLREIRVRAGRALNDLQSRDEATHIAAEITLACISDVNMRPIFGGKWTDNENRKDARRIR